MKFIFASVFLVVAVLSSLLGNGELAFFGLAAIVGFLLAKVSSLSKEIKSLRESLAKDWEERHRAAIHAENTQAITPNSRDTTSPVKSETIQNHKTETQSDAIDEQQQEYLDAISQASNDALTDKPPVTDTTFARDEAIAPHSSASNKPAAPYAGQQQAVSESINKSASTAYVPPVKKNTVNNNPQSDVLGNIQAKVKEYFMGGNLFVRIGIIILFFGVSFLLKYVSDRGFFPIEYRLIGVVIGAMVLLGLGWRLRHKNETYALLLQGAGIGVLYLDIFAAFSMYKLITPILAFVLLFVVSMLSTALAVLQDSKSLAILGFSGGFLAPVLSSSGSNNHVYLFSYYAVLNIAIVVIAWFKAWRSLNLLGFVFTFIIGTAWGVLRYNDTKFATTEPFLILFFLFYVLIAVLFALRQPPKLRGYVDGSLLFGVPLAASALQYSLVKDFEYGVSISSFAMGLFYIVLSWFVWKRRGDSLKLLSEAFLALGVIFASMAIPFALAPTQTAAAWALEGAGLLWLGSRQDRLSVRVFGLILQVGAGIIFLSRYNYDIGFTAFINAHFISTMLMAIAGIISARILFSEFKGRKTWEKGMSSGVLIWGLLWLFGGFTIQFLTFYTFNWLASNLLILTALVSFGFTLAAQRFKPEWTHAWYVASGLFVLVLLLGLLQTGIYSTWRNYLPSQYNGWIAWPMVFAVFYYHLYQLQKHQIFQRIQPIFHSLLLILLSVLVTLEVAWYLNIKLTQSSAWLHIWYAIPATLVLWMIIKAKFWPFTDHQLTYRQQTGLVFAAYLSLWSLIALVSKGQSEPLPWMPLLNPMDIMVVIVLISLFKWWRSSGIGYMAAVTDTVLDKVAADEVAITQRAAFNQRVLVIGFAALVFLWLNFTLFRIAYHWFGLDYDFDVLFRSSWVQTAVSILWALSGVLLTLYSSRKNSRVLWLTGAILLALVVLKLFVIDLAALGSLGRIVSFLVVGALLISIGYFAPLPDKSKSEQSKEKSVENSNV